MVCLVMYRLRETRTYYADKRLPVETKTRRRALAADMKRNDKNNALHLYLIVTNVSFYAMGSVISSDVNLIFA